MATKIKSVKCWICNDSGLVLYFKSIDKIEYEFAYKCTCVRGQSSSSNLTVVPNIVAENLAIENYKTSQEISSKNIQELILHSKKEWDLLIV